jgi:hypothetical protein
VYETTSIHLSPLDPSNIIRSGIADFGRVEIVHYLALESVFRREPANRVFLTKDRPCTWIENRRLERGEFCCRE